MPCKILIRENLEYEVSKLASPLMNRSLEDANKAAKAINSQYGYPILKFSTSDYETMDYTVDIPSQVVDEYYEKELLLEQEEEARGVQAEDAERAGKTYDDTYMYQVSGSNLAKVTKPEIDGFQNTVETELLEDASQDRFSYKKQNAFAVLSPGSSDAFLKYIGITLKYNNKSIYPKEWYDDKRPDIKYIKSNNRKNSTLYDVIDFRTGEVLRTKVKLFLSDEFKQFKIKDKLVEQYGLDFNPTKVFSANRSIGFALYREKPSKAKYVAQAKKYLYEAIKMVDQSITGTDPYINLAEVESLLSSFPDEVWDYINTTYTPEDSTKINASTSLTNQIKFNLPKLGLIKGIEKITGIPLLGVTFKNFDRSGIIKKRLKVEWGGYVTITNELSARQLRIAINYYLKTKKYFKDSSEEKNVEKYAEHNNVDYVELRELVFGDIDKALENISHNFSGNSDEMELSKWRQSIREYNWQLVELFAKPNEEYQNTVGERITEKFKDKNLSNGVSHLDFFFSGKYNWLNINFNSISGDYYKVTLSKDGEWLEEVDKSVGPYDKVTRTGEPIRMYSKPQSSNYLQPVEVYNRLAAVIHEPFHALHALSYGTKEEKEMRKAFNALYKTDFGKELMSQAFGNTYNGRDLDYDTLYKEFTAFTFQLMLYPKQWINETDLRSNDIYEFISKVQGLQDKTYEETVRTYGKIGETEKTITEEEKIKLNFLQKLYNLIVSALNKVIPISKKFVKLLETSKMVEKTIIEDVFGETEGTVTKTLKLPENIKQQKEEFLSAIDELKASINTLMKVDSKLFSSENARKFFTSNTYAQESAINDSNLDMVTKDLAKTGLIQYEAIQSERDREIAYKLGEKFTKAFGIENTTISEADAYDLLKDTTTPYDGEPAFYFNNTVYFVEGNFTSDSVFHEYAHPFVKVIALNNPTLFRKLYLQAVGNTIGENIRAELIKENLDKPVGKRLTPESDRFMEEVLVRSMTAMAQNKLTGIKENDNLFKAFINNLLFAIKQIIKKLAGKVDVAKLDVDTTVDQLVDMMLGDDFIIDTSMLSKSNIAEFSNKTKSEIDNLLDELKSADAQDFINTINNVYTGITYQLNQLQSTPYRLKQLLKKKEGENAIDGEKVLRNIRSYLYSSQTITRDISEVDPEELLQAIKNQEKDFNIRAIQLVKSIGETQVFARKIQSIIKDIKSTKQHLKEDGVDILDFYINFLVEQKRFLEETLSTLNLDEDTTFNKNVLSILNVVNNTLTEAGKLRFEAMAKWISNNSDFINQAIVDKFNSKLFLILSPQGFTEQEVNAFSDDIVSKIKAGKLRKFDVSDIELPRQFSNGALIVKEIEKLVKKYISEDSAARMLRGEAGDIGSIAANINTYSNINDPVGVFFREMKIEKSKAAAKSHEEEIELIKALVPHLNAVGYNPNNTSMLADLIMFADKVGYVDNKDGEFKTMEVYSVLDKFKNWRADKAELEYNLDVARESKDKDAIRKALQDLWTFHEKYMHRKYKKEVYDIQKIWNQENVVIDPVTKEQITVTADESSEAYVERQMALDEMNTFSTSEFSTLDDLYEVTESSVAKRKYDQLFEVYDVNGEPKPLEERKKVLVRLKYRKESGKFYNFKTNYDRVQKDFDNFITAELAAENITSDQTELYNKAIEKFKEKNFRIAYTPEYFEEYRRIMTRINELTAKSKNNDVSLKLAELYRQRGVLVNIVTDKNGQPNGIHLKPEQIKKLKQVEEEIVELKEKFDRQTGLSKEDLKLISRYEYRIKMGTNPLSETEMADYKRLFNIKSALQLSKSEANELRQKFTELSQLNYIDPTEYYLDAFNEMLGDATAILEEKGLLDPNDFPGKQVQEITVENADQWVDSPILKKVMLVNPEFAEWFNKNHYEIDVYDSAIESYRKGYMRLNVWSIKKPSNEDYFVKTTLIDPITKNEITILGAPVSKYTYRSIKKEYLTGYNPLTDKVELEVGKYVDNRGEMLPREFDNSEESAEDNKYMNEEYAKLDKNSARGKLIAEYKKQFLKMQESKPKSSRLYLDMPRQGISSNLEYIQSGKAKEAVGGRIESIKGGLKSAFKRREDDYEKYNFNFDTEAQLVTTDIAGNEISRIPIFGTSRLQLADVSQDVLGVTSKYLYSLNEQQALIKNEPLAKALLRILEDPQNAIKNTSKASKDIKKKRNYNRFLNAKGENERLKLVETYIDRVFYGQNVSSFQENNPTTTKVVKMLMGAASRSFIALDVQSALKNTYGMTFQKMIEVAGGQYMSYRSAAEGRMTAYKATVELSAKGIYQLGPKSLLLQMMEVFDPVTGKTKKDFGKSTSRTFIKDMLDATFLYDGRKLLELNASLQLFFGMMHHKTIEQTVGGKTSKIKYFDAFEMGDDSIIRLKPGIDPEWNYKPITHTYVAGESLTDIAEKYSTTVDRIKELNLSDTFEPGDVVKISDAKLFNDYKLKIQGTGKRLNGQIADEDNPRASKYLLYNLATFYRKFALPMFLNRFQADMSKENRWGEVYDFDMGTTTRGYYITAIDATIRMLKDFKATYPTLTEEEKGAIKKVLAEGLMLFALFLVATFLFGYDPGDEDRFEKLKAKEERFGGLGWMSNEMLYLTIMVQRENQMFVPVPGIGIDEWLDLTESTSIATSPTLELYSKIFMDIFYLATGNDKAYYKQDVGPYYWQQQGSTKLGNHIGSIFGLKGKNVSPIWAIKKAEAFENLK